MAPAFAAPATAGARVRRSSAGANTCSASGANANGGRSRRGRGNSRARGHRSGAAQPRGGARSAIQAEWCGKLLARSADYKFVDGRFYFPRDSVDWTLMRETGLQGHRNPYGRIEWFDVVANGRRNARAAWRFLPLKKPWASLSGFTAFWKGVRITQAPLPPAAAVDPLEPAQAEEAEIVEWL